VPPLLAIRQIRPILILRRDMAEQGGKRQWRQQLPSLAAGTALLLGIGAIAAWLGEGTLAERLRLGAYFAAGLAVSLLLLAGVATVLLRLLRRVRQMRVAPVIRHGLANLYRPGNQAAAVLVALGIGVMFTLTVYLVQTQVLEQLRESAPPGMANVFLIDIRTQQKDALVQFLGNQPGVEGAPEIIPATPARIVRVNGRPIDQLGLKNFERRFLQTRTVTSAERRSAFTEIRAGQWPVKLDEFALAEDAAKALNVQPGATLDFTASGVDFQSRVACIYKTEEIRLGSTVEFMFPPGRLEGLPLTYFGGARVRPDKIAPLQRSAYRQFPNITVVNIADVLEILQEVVDQISVVIRFVSGFAILAGAIILAAAIAGTRFRRLREVAILKTLGGTRSRIRSIFSVEFLALGGAAGLLGSLLAIAFSQLILRQLFEVDPRWDWISPLFAVLASALLANAAGWLASARILEERPLAVLRSE
jgi:putative ABC transport system permease protein